MRAWFAWILDHRPQVLALLVALSLAAGASLSRVTLGSSIKKLFFGDAPEYLEYIEQSRIFSNDVGFVIAVDRATLTGGAPGLPLDAAERLRAASRAVAEVPGVHAVASIDSAVQVRVDEGGALLLESPLEQLLGLPEAERAARLASLAEDPRLGGLLVGEGGEALALQIELDVNPDRTGEEGAVLIDQIAAAMASAGLQRGDWHLAGLPAVLVGMLELTWENLLRLFPAAVIGLLGVIFLLFRRMSPAALSVGVALIAVLWTMGIAALWDPEFSVLITAVPAVVLVVSFSDVIHLWSAYETERRHGHDQREAILRSAADVGKACLLTSVTTFVGFISLALTPTPMFRQMGVTLSIGVAIALGLAVTLVPLALSAMSAAPPPPERGAGRLTTALVGQARAASAKRPGWIIAGSLLLAAWGAQSMRGLHIDTDLAGRIDEDRPIRRDEAWIGERFSGDNIVQLFISTDAPGGAVEAPLLQRLAALQEELRQRPKVQHSLSAADVIAELHGALTNGPAALPSDPKAVAQELLLLEMAGGDAGLSRLLDEDRGRALLNLRLQPMGMRATADEADQIAAIASARLAPARVSVTGIRPLLGRWLDGILTGQTLGVALSLVGVTALMAIGLRSVRIGLMSMIPNVIPLVVLGGLWGAFYESIDSDVFIIWMMAVGIAVDDTIHFLMRCRVELERAPPGPAGRAEAVGRTFDFAGRAIVMTTLVLMAGFLPFALSDYLTLRLLGIWIPVVLLLALLADLLLVPAMVQVGWFRLDEGRGPR